VTIHDHRSKTLHQTTKLLQEKKNDEGKRFQRMMCHLHGEVFCMISEPVGEVTSLPEVSSVNLNISCLHMAPRGERNFLAKVRFHTLAENCSWVLFHRMFITLKIVRAVNDSSHEDAFLLGVLYVIRKRRSNS